MAKGSPSTVLRKVDLPTLLRPIRVTVPKRMRGRSVTDTDGEASQSAAAFPKPRGPSPRAPLGLPQRDRPTTKRARVWWVEILIRHRASRYDPRRKVLLGTLRGRATACCAW